MKIPFIVTANIPITNLLPNPVKVWKNLPTMGVYLLTWEEVRTLRDNPAITAIERDIAFKVSRDVSNPDNWGLDRIDQRSLPLNARYQSTASGTGVDIYFIDTGIDIRHAEFSNRADPVWDYRAAFQIGNTIIHFENNLDLTGIIQTINEQYGSTIASNESSCLRLEVNNLPLLNVAGHYSSFLENAFGIPSGIQTTSVVGTKVNPIISQTTFPSYAIDDNGHGTHVAGIAAGETYGIAINARLKSVKAFSNTSEAQTSTILSAMDYILSQSGKIVVNMSFGGIKSTAMDTAVLEMSTKGMVCCVAAGNSGTNAFTISPAGAGTNSTIIYQRDEMGNLVLDSTGNPIPIDERYTFDPRKPIVVGASDTNDQFAYFSNYSEGNFTLAGSGSSNYGSVVDIIAPGVKIRSANLNERNTRYGKILSGTSMATPHVSGVAALHLEMGVQPNAVRDLIIQQSTKDVLRFSYAPAKAKDRTENRLLYMPYGAVTFFWKATGNILKADEQTSVDVMVTAYSRDGNGQPLSVRYSVDGTIPTPGQVMAIGYGLVLVCDTGQIIGTLPDVTATTDLTFSLWAIDDRGEKISGQFTITVNLVNHPPYIITPSGRLGTYQVGDLVGIPLIAGDPDLDTLRFTIISGELPPGLEILRNGTIYGQTGDVRETTDFLFVVRVSDGMAVYDRTYDIVLQAENDLPSWKEDWLPSLKVVAGYSVRSFGRFNVGDYVAISLMAEDPEDDTLTWAVADSPYPITDPDHNGKLPNGLFLRGGSIIGTIQANTPLGNWFFDLTVTDGKHGSQVVAQTFVFEISDQVAVSQTWQSITANPLKQTIGSILGGSRITGIDVTVLSPFSGLKPKMRIGDTTDYGRLVGWDEIDLTTINTFNKVLNYKYNSVNDVNIAIEFADSSTAPSYFVELRNTKVTNITLQTSGSGYHTAPQPVIQFGGGAGAKAISDLKAISVKIADRGTGYLIGDVIRLLGGTTSPTQYLYNGTSYSLDRPTTIRVTDVNSTGGIRAFAVMDAGYYLSAPNNPVTVGPGVPTLTDTVKWSGSVGTGATFTVDYGVRSVTVTDGGLSYLTPPEVTFPGNGITGGTLQITLHYIPSDLTVFFGNIKWVTDRGLIGELRETEASALSVRARASNASPVTYALAPGSKALPVGLAIDATTGDIMGQCGFVNQDTIYPFTVRASVGATFQDREFSILVRSIFNSKPVTGVGLQITGPDRIAWREFAKKYIDDQYIFRPLDERYGRQNSPYMNVLFGMKDVTPDAFWNAIKGNEERPLEYDHHRDVDLCVGEVKFAHARNGKGEVLYDVIYRPIVDPLDRIYARKGHDLHVYAGGWSGGSRNPVQYPQSADPYFLYPSSIANMRRDLQAEDQGGVGMAGQEMLPLWMTCQQIQGDKTSVLGFVPAIVLAYVLPNTGADIVRSLKVRNVVDKEMGSRVTLDRYYLTRWSSVETTFDDGILVPSDQDYPFVATRDNDTNEPAVIPATSLYQYSNGGTVDRLATLQAINATADNRALADGRPTASQTNDWLASDYRPHENPSLTETVFDNRTTTFDYALSITSEVFKFPPGDANKYHRRVP